MFLNVIVAILTALPGLPVSLFEDEIQPTSVLVQKAGYPFEAHYVTTEDGYILEIHRIPYSPTSPLVQGQPKPVLLLNHGLLGSSSQWLLNSPGKQMGLLLADAGYDVWMGNNRGNLYSRNHTTLNPNGYKFWQFTWHEFGIYDNPAMIDYILAKTGQPKLKLIGHSQGTVQVFVLLSKKPEYNDKVETFISLAQTAFMEHIKSILHLVTPLFLLPGPLTTLIARILSVGGRGEFLITPELRTLLILPLCSIPVVNYPVCASLFYLLGGPDPPQYNNSLTPISIGHFFEGCSMFQFVHFAQSVNTGYFREYDFGVFGNLEKYGRLSPPDYPLAKITTKVVLFHADNDWLSDTVDAKKLENALSNVKSIRVDDPLFSHFDYITAIDLERLVMIPMLSELAQQ